MMANNEMNILMRNCSDLVAVDRLTLAVAAGEIFSLLGSNGVSKST